MFSLFVLFLCFIGETGKGREEGGEGVPEMQDLARGSVDATPGW